MTSLRTTTLVPLVLLLAATPAALPAQRPDLDPRVTSQIDSLFRPFDRSDSPGYAVGIVRDGQLVFAKGYGRANLDDDVAITSRTAFHLASLSKQFTAAAVALLIQDGALSLEAPVSKYIPETAKYGPDLRIKHLVYFTSGLHEYFALPRANGDPWFSSHYFTVDDALRIALTPDTLKFAPGARWDYSNSDYMLLARIVERVSGKPFGDFLQARVFAPLGMSNTHLDDDATLIVRGRATGYVRRDDPGVRGALESVGVHIRAGTGFARMVRTSPHYGGSGVFSTLEDLARWDASFSNGRLGAGFAQQMLQRTKFAHDKTNDAFGLVIGSYRGQEMIWFSGGDFDTSTYMARFPQARLSIYCLSNLATGNAEEKCGAVREILQRAGVLESAR